MPIRSRLAIDIGRHRSIWVLSRKCPLEPPRTPSGCQHAGGRVPRVQAMPTSTSTSLPSDRPSRVVVEPVAPLVDGGSFPAKATMDEPVTVLADVFSTATTAPLPRCGCASGGSGWREIPMQPLGNDRFTATFVPDQLGRWQYQVVGWLDHLGTWRHGMELKLAPASTSRVDVLIGVGLIERGDRAGPRPPTSPPSPSCASGSLAGDTRPLGLAAGRRQPARRRSHPEPRRRRAGARRRSTSTPCSGAPACGHPVAELAGRSTSRSTSVRARFSSWYEFFPRSTLAPTDWPRHARRRRRPRSTTSPRWASTSSTCRRPPDRR